MKFVEEVTEEKNWRKLLQNLSRVNRWFSFSENHDFYQIRLVESY